MIVLDTHIWVWWLHDEAKLTNAQTEIIKIHESDVIGISVFSIWEVAKLVERKRIELPFPLHEWFAQALSYPGVRILDLTPEIAIESTRLPGEFHRDPADQVIVATARIHQCALVTSDEKIRHYPHVESVG
ncbi:MAG: type II toxin-antitoxin system VapC family toxin [Anaerolineales bacterium]|nr:type II toxin-antitoxin system VapC family toxin [Anaerolineales bacterium]